MAVVPQSAKETSSATVAATPGGQTKKKEEQDGSSPSASYQDVVGITTHAHENGLAVMTDKKSGAQD